MDSILKKGLFLVTLTGAISSFSMIAQAADLNGQSRMPGIGIEQILGECYSSDKEIAVKEYLVPTEKGEYLDMAFANVDSFLYIRSEPTTQSTWVGKLYPDAAAKIVGPVGEWTKVQSGTVTGYVYSQYILVGNKAEAKAEELIRSTEDGTPEQAFVYAESRDEEEIRLAKEAEEAERIAREQAAEAAAKGQEVVDFACNFVGNPYVWGGTSLTEGADCSGFVQSVFAHFGVDLPRTSGEMRYAGTEVSYEEAVAGDIVCYDGHVGIYMGDGQIVNAINSQKGIGYLPATYTSILTIRRLL